mmetsp:Transcript_129651/g.192972  ORF Transcript_129651/g.192972 Transcript_129651/m.192972 type:complete len:88 (-) Transcript_129651:331-594(-)
MNKSKVEDKTERIKELKDKIKELEAEVEDSSESDKSSDASSDSNWGKEDEEYQWHNPFENPDVLGSNVYLKENRDLRSENRKYHAIL